MFKIVHIPTAKPVLGYSRRGGASWSIKKFRMRYQASRFIKINRYYMETADGLICNSDNISTEYIIPEHFTIVEIEDVHV